jgi:hypothetical protein
MTRLTPTLAPLASILIVSLLLTHNVSAQSSLFIQTKSDTAYDPCSPPERINRVSNTAILFTTCFPFFFSPSSPDLPTTFLFLLYRPTTFPFTPLLTNYPIPHIQGDPFVVGIAYWPGTTIEQWGAPYVNNNSTFPGLNPCLGNVTFEGETTNYREYLARFGVMFSTFAVKVDTLTALRTTRAEEDQLFDAAIALASVNAAFKGVLSIIAFRGTLRSEVKYIRSDSTEATGGTGVVTKLALLLNFDRGDLNGFEWYDFGSCEECGGLNGANCITTKYNEQYQKYPMSTCAVPLNECICRGLNCNAGDCVTTIYTGARGSSDSGQSFTSAYQIQNINQFSITGIFFTLFNNVENVFRDVSGNINQPGDITQNADSTTVGGGSRADPESDQALFDERDTIVNNNNNNSGR